jgi:hypothetical protein
VSEIVKEVRAVAVSRGGRPDRILTRYDHERGGRVLEATLFFPGESGYDNAERLGLPKAEVSHGD